MPFCCNCGAKLTGNEKFCSECGSALSTSITPNTTATSNTQPNSQRKTSYDGEILKCPSCGETLPSFTANCPTCGFELRSIRTSSSVKELVEKLEKIENQRTAQSWSSFVQEKINNPFGKKISFITQQKINLIKNFPIPNTKEDIQEFIILATTNMETNFYNRSKTERIEQDSLAEAWRVKCEQAKKKANFLFKDDERESILVKNEKGWHSWNGLQKMLWVFLNIYTFGIPALIYALTKLSK